MAKWKAHEHKQVRIAGPHDRRGPKSRKDRHGVTDCAILRGADTTTASRPSAVTTNKAAICLASMPSPPRPTRPSNLSAALSRPIAPAQRRLIRESARHLSVSVPSSQYCVPSPPASRPTQPKESPPHLRIPETQRRSPSGSFRPRSLTNCCSVPDVIEPVDLYDTRDPTTPSDVRHHHVHNVTDDTSSTIYAQLRNYSAMTPTALQSPSDTAFVFDFEPLVVAVEEMQSR